jgi:hypothetical protein
MLKKKDFFAEFKPRLDAITGWHPQKLVIRQHCLCFGKLDFSVELRLLLRRTATS